MAVRNKSFGNADLWDKIPESLKKIFPNVNGIICGVGSQTGAFLA